MRRAATASVAGVSRHKLLEEAKCTLLSQDPQEAEAVQVELKACSLWLLCQLLPVLLNPLQGWLKVLGMDLHACSCLCCERKPTGRLQDCHQLVFACDQSSCLWHHNIQADEAQNSFELQHHLSEDLMHSLVWRPQRLAIGHTSLLNKTLTNHKFAFMEEMLSYHLEQVNAQACSCCISGMPGRLFCNQCDVHLIESVCVKLDRPVSQRDLGDKCFVYCLHTTLVQLFASQRLAKYH